MTFDTPILVIVWRRPNSLRQLLTALRSLEPDCLFFACDGPNPSRLGEAEKVAATRATIEQEVNWPCKVHRLFSETNLGCRIGVSSAISWFFNNVEEGIILEDDCIPHLDFFEYASILLERYRNDTRIWSISGTNLQPNIYRGDCDYYFSKYFYSWGWAGWRRSWIHYEPDLKALPSFIHSGFIESIFHDPIERKFWKKIWENLYYRNMPDTWDYQWFFSCISNGGLTIVPNQNLINNIGFDSDATHTTSRTFKVSKVAGIKVRDSFPKFILPDIHADSYIFNYVFGGKYMRLPFSLCLLPTKFLRLLRIWKSYLDLHWK